MRYQLLAYWYTLFHLAEQTGVPTMRPMWVEFADDAKTWAMDKQFMAGPHLLVAPVFTRGATSVGAYFPAGRWYDVDDGTAYDGPKEATLAAPITKVPVFQRGGSVLPRQMRLRRSSAQMLHDPYTLVVAPDASGAAAEGALYLDEGDGYAYRDAAAYHLRKFTYSAGTLASSASHAAPDWTPPNTLERVEVLGVAEPERVSLTHKGATRDLTFHMAADRNRRAAPDPPLASPRALPRSLARRARAGSSSASPTSRWPTTGRSRCTRLL